MLVAHVQNLNPHMQCKLKGTKIHALQGNFFLLSFNALHKSTTVVLHAVVPNQ